MRCRALALGLVAIACGASDPHTGDAARRASSALYAPGAGAADRYIVVFAPGVADPHVAANALVRGHGGTLGFVYRHALRGFSAALPSAAVDAIARSPLVSYVERDQVMEAFAQQVPTGIHRAYADANPNIRIDGVDDYRVDVDVAVIDTGIDLDHPDLNVVARTDCSTGSPWRATCIDGTGDDGNGHGTHTAGTIGAIDNGVGVVGVAPGARLYSVKVLGDNGSGWNSGIIAGVDWVTARAATIDVVNMSLGGGNSTALCDAIKRSVARDVVYAVAAGNSDDNAAKYSPANCADAITVSALADFDGLPGGLGTPTCRADQDDTLADFSNWGSTVEIAAPGVCILSTWTGGGYATLSGTSMASPHVAGAAALLKASGVGSAASVRQKLLASGNLGWTDDSGDGVKEPLLDVRDTTVFVPAMVAGSATPGDTTPPVITAVTPAATSNSATITWTTNEPSDSTVSFGTDPAAFATVSSAALVTSHSVTLSGLDPETTYLYEVRSTDAAENTATNPALGPDRQYYSFTTSVAPPPPSTITLTASGYKVKGVQHATLAWTNATSVYVFRDDQWIATTTGTTYDDFIGKKGGGTYVYKVCVDSTQSLCSNEATVTF